MTHGLWLRVDDSLTQINMVNAALGYTLLGYAPESAADGQEFVTETCKLYVFGATVAELQARLQVFDTFFSIARLRQERGTGSKIWAELRVSGEAVTHRSEIVDGRCVYDEGALRHWANTSVEVTLIWTRRYWWEAKTPVEIPLKNGSIGAKATGGVTIFNHDDGDANHDNWVDIVAADVIGAIPAPLYVTLRNTSGVNLGTYRFYISNNVFGGPAGTMMILEGEASTGGGSNTSNSAHSNGSTRTYTWGAATAHSTLAYVWELNQMSNTKGHWFNVLARLAAAPTANTFVQLSIRFPASTPLTTLWQGPEIELGSGDVLQHLGAVPLPPVEMAVVPSMALVLTVRCPTAGALNIDFLQLSGPDGFHHFRQNGYQLKTTDTVVVDGPEERTYVLDNTGYHWSIYSEYSPRVRVWPGQNQRVRVLFDEGGSMNIARTWTMRAWYKPRRVTL